MVFFPKWVAGMHEGITLGGEQRQVLLPILWQGASTSCCGVNLAFSGFGGVCLFFPKWARGQYFGENAESFYIDPHAAREEAPCCGVNLAFSGFPGGGAFFSEMGPRTVRWGKCRIVLH